MKKFIENKFYGLEKDFVLNKEFFKWLENLSEGDHQKFCKYILNTLGDSCIYAYPKVTIKTIFLVLISCYNTKEWIEWRKRKYFVRKELNKMKPRFYLYKTKGEFN